MSDVDGFECMRAHRRTRRPALFADFRGSLVVVSLDQDVCNVRISSETAYKIGGTYFAFKANSNDTVSRL